MSQLELIKKLREMTGAGMLDVQQALAEANNDEAKTIEILRKKGRKIASKRAERATAQGVIGNYIHASGKVASLVSLCCETDFVARTDAFKEFAHDLALQVAATAPQYLNPSEVPADIITKEKEIYREQMAGEKKPADVIEKIIEGKLQKFYSEVCLMNQKSIKDDTKTVEQLLTELIGRTGENVKVTKFAYYTL